MKVYTCQFDIAWEDKPANFKKVQKLLADAKPDAGSLILLPEMFATGFSMNVKGIAEDPDHGPTLKFLAECASRFNVYAGGGFVSQNEIGKGQNELAIVAPDGTKVAHYTKIHPFSYGEESKHYVGGDRVCTFQWAGATVAPFICYDLRFPEIFRRAVRFGAEVLVVIANWPVQRQEHWIALLRARAIENQAFVAGVNRIGSDPKSVYSGHSLIVDPQGKIISDAGSAAGVCGAEIDLDALRAHRAAFPALADIRSDLV